MNPPPPKTRWLWFLFWLALLCMGFFVDRPVAEWVHRAVPLDKTHSSTRHLIFIVRLPGNFGFTVAVAALLVVFHPRSWHAAAALLASGAASGVNHLIKWITGRHRPVVSITAGGHWRIPPFTFHPFPRGIWGLVKEPALCFPSGDATLAFVMAASLSILVPRGKWAFYGIALLVALERVMENAHYVSDVIAGSGLGIVLGAFLTRWVLKRLEPRGPMHDADTRGAMPGSDALATGIKSDL